MFRSFFLSRRWLPWSLLGTVLICLAIGFRVKLDLMINDWFGAFYDTIQTALTTPGEVSFAQLMGFLWTFATIAGVSILIAVLLQFFLRHYIFRWRTAMNDYYTGHWTRVRHIEGASQRIQEDTMRFAQVAESIGAPLVQAVMTLAAFLPLLIGLSSHVTELPWVGAVPYSLVWVALLWSVLGTVLLATVGIKLPGLEFNNQRVEAAYRKELVLGEDFAERAEPMTLSALFTDVRRNYFTLFRHYLYFDVARYSYLQFGMLVPLIAMAPTIVTGAITLGLLQQVLRAFDKVEASFQFLITSWSTIVEMLSIYKRLQGFEKRLKGVDADPSGPAGGSKAPPSPATD